MSTYMRIFAIATLAAASVITGCKKDSDNPATPPPPSNESEVMTTFKLSFVDSAGISPNVSAQFRDPDGDGGSPAVQFDSIFLLPNKTYYASVLILDETKTPVDTISNEVAEEANDHLFFYTPSAGLNEVITILDYDAHSVPLPLGLQTKWKTGAISTGTTHIVLRHQPGVKDGSFAPGETDLDIAFETRVQ
jgi:hypothetical protein